MRDTFVIGDTHGDFVDFYNWQMRFGVKDFNIIHVGDIGVGFPHYKQNWLEKLNRGFARRGIKFYGIRGNHDNPKYFDGTHQYSNLQLVPDETVLKIEDKNYFFYGGAVSVDRQNRKQGWDYWRGEKTNKFNTANLLSHKSIDTVITHSCPRRVIPVPFPTNVGQGTVQRFANAYTPDIRTMTQRFEGVEREKRLADPHLIDDMNEELDRMDKLEELLQSNFEIREWYFGHFHKSMTTRIMGTRYQCLDISEITPIQS